MLRTLRNVSDASRQQTITTSIRLIGVAIVCFTAGFIGGTSLSVRRAESQRNNDNDDVSVSNFQPLISLRSSATKRGSSIAGKKYDTYSMLPVNLNLTAQGHFDFGENITSVVIDVGLEHWSFFVPYTKVNASVAVLGVEALPRNYFNTRARTHEWARANKIDRRRLQVVNLAIGPNTTMATFRTAWAPACGSILPTASTNSFWCAESVDEVTLPMITLERLIRLVPPRVRLSFLKVDVEGADLVVARSGGSLLSRFDGVTIECQNVTEGGRGQHRRGGCTAREAETYFRSMGFGGGGCAFAEGENGNCHFGKDDEAARRAKEFFLRWEQEGYRDVKMPPPDAGC
jgi:FkbM family methyltransferase